jgi:hypothetical protein
MKVTVDIKDNKALFFLELVKNLSFVKKVETEETPSKKEILKGIREAVKEVNLIKAGKMKGKPIQQLLDEL